MTPPERRTIGVFAVRFAILFAISLLPIPWLADAYVTFFSAATSPVLSLACAGSDVGIQLELPSHIEKEGSWKANLRLEDRLTKQAGTLRFDMWSLSYRPMVTFLALAGASSLHDRRRRLLLWTAGTLGMFLITMCFSALPLLSRFAFAGAFGHLPGLFVRTVYQATATPIMVYALPVLVFGLVIHLTRPETVRTGAASESRSADPPGSSSVEAAE